MNSWSSTMLHYISSLVILNHSSIQELSRSHDHLLGNNIGSCVYSLLMLLLLFCVLFMRQQWETTTRSTRRYTAECARHHLDTFLFETKTFIFINKFEMYENYLVFHFKCIRCSFFYSIRFCSWCCLILLCICICI